MLLSEQQLWNKMTDSGILLDNLEHPIRLHLSWFVIFSLSPGRWLRLPAVRVSTASTTVIWVIAALTSVLFALSVLLHELGHSFVAQRNEVPVSVTLFLFGGVATISKEPQNGKAELLRHRRPINQPAPGRDLWRSLAGRSLPFWQHPAPAAMDQPDAGIIQHDPGFLWMAAVYCEPQSGISQRLA